ncbi:TPA: hypothetical protein NKR25_002573 [Vibrio parahaemolyticus]|nr:hypothetical protein [Vibrio parahaemolyticus]
MDKTVVLAVAGAGKSKTIIDRLSVDSRCLIVTYTENNTLNLQSRILNKFGSIPKGIRVYSYFTFLFSFCFRPVIGDKAKGINFAKKLPVKAQMAKKNTKEHFIDDGRRIYSSRIAKLFTQYPKTGVKLCRRIEKYFDLVCVDEVQDFAANDFNLLLKLADANVELLLLGDFFQHTFDTSRDSRIQENLHKNLQKYKEKFENAGYNVDTKSLLKSHRCSPSVCDFVSKKIGIEIESHRKDKVQVTFIDDLEKVDKLFQNDSLIKLFYSNSDKYHGYTNNWGNTKGLDDFNDVCVVLNKTTLTSFKNDKLNELKSTTKNKLYVACTRAKGSLFFVPYHMVAKFKI